MIDTATGTKKNPMLFTKNSPTSSTKSYFITLVVNKINEEDIRWVLKPINMVLNHYDGEVKISPRGSLKIGTITLQRKGGDGGRPTANKLQFKANPLELFDEN